jgi:hypothetical protein
MAEVFHEGLVAFRQNPKSKVKRYRFKKFLISTPPLPKKGRGGNG